MLDSLLAAHFCVCTLLKGRMYPGLMSQTYGLINIAYIGVEDAHFRQGLRSFNALLRHLSERSVDGKVSVNGANKLKLKARVTDLTRRLTAWDEDYFNSVVEKTVKVAHDCN